MSEIDDFARRNRDYWRRQVEAGAQYTRPWLHLTREQARSIADGDCAEFPYMYPPRVFEDVAGKDVLCLASGGGQQSAVFGLLGARVTVFDITEGQLEGDRVAARHHGYWVVTVQGDMRDLSVFEDASFDIVYQEISLVFVPDVRPVYAEVARVLRPGGVYRVAHENPATADVEETSWDGRGYAIATPYRGGLTYEEDDVEFRHLMTDIFGGLVENGFIIEGVWEDPRHLCHVKAEPGSYEHLLTFVGAYFAIVACKHRERLEGS